MILNWILDLKKIVTKDTVGTVEHIKYCISMKFPDLIIILWLYNRTPSVLHEFPPRTQPYLAISTPYQAHLTQYRKKLENGLQVLPGQPTPSLASYHSAHRSLCFSPVTFAVDLTAQRLLPQGLCPAFPSICTTLPPDKQLVNSFTFFKSLLKYYLLKS